MKKKMEFKGTIEFISCSPHGDPEGVVLDDGTFVKVPPHSLLKKDLFEVGAKVTGTGELLTETPNRVFHHVKLAVGKQILSDDSMDKDEREELKEAHHRDLEKRKDAPSKQMKVKGVVVAVGTKPKGEVDRLIFEDGTSVHIPKHVELSSDEVEIGATFEVEGEARVYKNLRFMKAEEVRAV